LGRTVWLATTSAHKLWISGPHDVAEHLKTPEGMAAYLEASLEEANGGAVFIAKTLERSARFYPDVGIVNIQVNATWPDIPLIRGASMTVVEMKNLAKVDFGPDGEVTVALKRGTMVSGKLNSGKAGIDGFIGTCEKGRFFIDLKHVRSIDFSKNQPSSR
jgi:hypothetical protein